RTFKEAFLLTLPVMAGYIVLGIGFGVLLQSKGYNFAWAILMSLTIYAGSMQYLAVDLLSTGASLLSVALMTLMVNARHLFYSISMLKKYAKTGKKKPLLIFELTDETFSIICSAKPPPDIDKNWFYFFISFLNQIYWIVGSAAGSIFASLIDFDSSGIEFSMTALFVVTFLEQWLR
ncbi:MAG: AzlC family ABC transporter permease, partial [Clostridiales bacterium]